MIVYVTCKYIKYTIKKTIRTGILEYLSSDDNDDEFYYEDLLAYEGKVLDISANGSLIVERMDEANKGLIEELISGEVSIRR